MLPSQFILFVPTTFPNIASHPAKQELYFGGGEEQMPLALGTGGSSRRTVLELTVF